MKQHPNRLRRLPVYLATVAALTVPLGTTQAAMVSTQSAVASAQGAAARDTVSAAFARTDVRRALEAQGVDPAEAQARLAALSDAEVQQVAARLEELPAGGFGILGAVAVVAIIFVITDAMGITNVYNFVVPQR